MKEINVGLLGCGTVGIGTAKILLEKQDLIASRSGVVLNLKKIADIDTERDRGLDLAPGVMTADAGEVIDAPDMDIVVELIGGETIAKEFLLRAIKNGKHIVTANKALLSSCGDEIFPLAAKNNVDVAYEASVGGCMPIIKSIRESLVGNHIHTIRGILNGTCNYILTKITAEGCSFDAALAQAQKKGFAEADPTLDVDGMDTAHKLAIVNAIAYGMEINLDDIYIEGIRKVTPLDIEFADQFDYVVKLLAISKRTNSGVEARIHPTMIPKNDVLASVSGSLNAAAIKGDCVDEMLLYGHGAGMMPTASAVVSDIVDLARNIVYQSQGRVPLLSYQPDRVTAIPVLPVDKISTRYYFRFSALDKPGVLSKIAGILGEHNISIKSVNQKGRVTDRATDGQGVPLVMMTHLACEADVNNALADIAALDIVDDDPVVIRVEDKNGD